jgi:hypothetical protein
MNKEFDGIVGYLKKFWSVENFYYFSFSALSKKLFRNEHFSATTFCLKTSLLLTFVLATFCSSNINSNKFRCKNI